MTSPRAPYLLGPMPTDRAMTTLDERSVAAPARTVFDVVRRVEHWPAYLAHYRYVRFRERHDIEGGVPSRGIVEMSAYRPFGPVGWPTWWLSEMVIDFQRLAIRFFHIGGITKGMDVEWLFAPDGDRTHVTLLHVWNGPPVPLLGPVAATAFIGPVFIHGIASRTLAGLSAVAEREHREAGGATRG